MSGIEISIEKLSELQSDLYKVLDRSARFDPLAALIGAISPGERIKFPIRGCAIAFDSNVFLRLSGHAKIADIIDFLSSEHDAPIVLPGQTIQEFWNNQLAAVDTMASGITKKFDQFKAEVVKLPPEVLEYSEKMNAVISEFNVEFGHVYEESSVRSTLSLLQTLKEKAIVSHVHRGIFQNMAVQRKRAKTPPGFKDEGDGDFFVWVDFLYGLLQAKASGAVFEKIVLVTQDRKSDWSRKGIPHPILTAEVNALLGMDFDLWTISDLHKAIVER